MSHSWWHTNASSLPRSLQRTLLRILSSPDLVVFQRNGLSEVSKSAMRSAEARCNTTSCSKSLASAIVKVCDDITGSSCSLLTLPLSHTKFRTCRGRRCGRERGDGVRTLILPLPPPLSRSRLILLRPKLKLFMLKLAICNRPRRPEQNPFSHNVDPDRSLLTVDHQRQDTHRYCASSQRGSRMMAILAIRR